MAYKKILLDTNSYLRLGNSIRPLLNTPFGVEEYSLYIHKELQLELDRNSRFQNKFYWINEDEYLEERKNVITCSRKQKKEIDDSYDFIWRYQKDNGYSISREDIYCISSAYVLNVTLVSDDIDLIEVAKDFDIEVLSTLGLLKLMLDNNHIEKKEIVAIAEYWKYNKDIPANYNKDYKKLFKSNPP